MITFEVKEREVSIGEKKGQTVYYAAPKSQPRFTAKMVEDRVVQATSLGRGDIRNAFTSLAEVVNAALEIGGSVDLADLGTLKVVVNSQQVDDPKNVNVSTLKTPSIRFYPKSGMLNAAKSVKLKVDNQYTKQSSETD